VASRRWIPPDPACGHAGSHRRSVPGPRPARLGRQRGASAPSTPRVRCRAGTSRRRGGSRSRPGCQRRRRVPSSPDPARCSRVSRARGWRGSRVGSATTCPHDHHRDPDGSQAARRRRQAWARGRHRARPGPPRGGVLGRRRTPQARTAQALARPRRHGRGGDRADGWLSDAAREALYVGRAQRTAHPRLRKALAIRDRHCQFPDCRVAAQRCHAHHVTHWEHGGTTDPANMLLLCHGHHHRVHEGGWVVTRRPGTRDGEPGAWDISRPRP